MSPKPGRWMVFAVVPLAAMVAQSFGRFTYAAILPALQEDLAISYTLAGSFGTANLVAYLVGSAAVSWATTRFALSAMIKGGLIASVGGLFLLWWSPNLGVLVLGMVVTGLAGAFIWIPAPGVVAAMANPARRGLAIGMVGAGLGVGFVVTGELVRMQINAGWRTIYRGEALFGLFVLVAAFAVLRYTTSVAASRPSLDAIRTVPGWIPLVAAYSAYGLSISLFVNFLVARLEEDAAFTPESAAVAFSMMGVASIFGGPIFGPISDRFGRSLAMQVGFAGMAGAALLALVDRQPWPVLGAVLFGLAFTGVPTALAAHISDHVDQRAFGAAFGLITLSFGAGQILAPQLGGWLGDITGSFTLVFVVSAVAAVVGMISATRVPSGVPEQSRR